MLSIYQRFYHLFLPLGLSQKKKFEKKYFSPKNQLWSKQRQSDLFRFFKKVNNRSNVRIVKITNQQRES